MDYYVCKVSSTTFLDHLIYIKGVLCSELKIVLPVHNSKETSPQPTPRMTFDLAEYYQLQLGVERIRIPEVLFQPSIIGHDQAGLAETLDQVLRSYDSKTQDRLAQVSIWCEILVSYCVFIVFFEGGGVQLYKRKV